MRLAVLRFLLAALRARDGPLARPDTAAPASNERAGLCADNGATTAGNAAATAATTSHAFIVASFHLTPVLGPPNQQALEAGVPYPDGTALCERLRC
jgi:hypothetical protein